jgi:hypothetical protein
MRATKEARGSSINQNEETHHRNTMSNPFAPFLLNNTSPPNIQQEAPTNMIISLLKV